MKTAISFLVLFFGGQMLNVAHAETLRDCDDCPEMITIPAGSFEMGSGGVSPNEKPAHQVTIATFAMGKTEITQAQWKAVMGSNPSYFPACGDACPVEMVSWTEAQEFIAKRNEKT